MFDKPIVITNRDYRFLVAEQLSELGVEATIVLEPERRDSGPAVAVAAALAAQRGRTPSSPYLPPIISTRSRRHFSNAPSPPPRPLPKAISSVSVSSLLTLRPISATSGPGATVEGTNARKVEAFVEKPDVETANRYIAEGYLWNSGNFVFPAELMRSEIASFEPEMAAAVDEAVAKARTGSRFCGA